MNENAGQRRNVPDNKSSLKRDDPLFGLVYTAIRNFYHRLKHQRQSNLSLFVLGRLPLLLVPSTGTTPCLGRPSDGSASGIVTIAPRARPVCVLSKLDSGQRSFGKTLLTWSFASSNRGPKVSTIPREKGRQRFCSPCEINPFLSQAVLRNGDPYFRSISDVWWMATVLVTTVWLHGPSS